MIFIFTIKALKQASYNQKKHLDVGVSFVYPCPIPSGNGITYEQVLEENLCFLRKLKSESYMPDSVLITPAAPLPATVWQIEPRRFGFNLPEDYLQTILRYEYELTKDPSTWPELNISLHGMKFMDMLKMAGSHGEKGSRNRLYGKRFRRTLPCSKKCWICRSEGVGRI